MPIINVRIDNTIRANPKTFKAPKDTMYKISDIYTDIKTNAALTAFVFTRAIGPGSLPSFQSDSIYSVSFDSSAKPSYSHFSNAELAKFISVVADSTSAALGRLYINYELVNASRTELIMEWFRKGR